MSYQSEAELEKQLISKLSSQGYNYIKLDNYKALENNFRVQLNYINKSVIEGIDLSDKEFERILIYLKGKKVYQSVKQLRDQFILDRDNGKQVYISLNENPENNIYQVTNQVTVQGKNQNSISDEDIERIVSAHSERKEIEKFCHFATMEEIEENDYNLNIPHYVDTFELEPEVNLQAAKKSIKTNIQKLEQEVQAYLDELGV